ncbi:uncharacterized protein EI90DRAFT_688613 [Cantharellus anzutake]|uniref:uncharacterized protein n=1 Tax=Cantharellus anzutake TaxID=1750568 RepID=UPI001904E4E7|nr:uncharacterized protein EI90DRAFT_688613 [Cantharellus anzutake]KAF8332685.1 hypothetical protein EI90DRAFT_688613 [Cantharellus anzutake]
MAGVGCSLGSLALPPLAWSNAVIFLFSLCLCDYLQRYPPSPFAFPVFQKVSTVVRAVAMLSYRHACLAAHKMTMKSPCCTPPK